MIITRLSFCILFIFTLNVSVNAQSNYLPYNTSGKIEFNEVVQVDSIKQIKLYTKASKWFLTFTKSPETKLTTITRDSLNGKITSEFQFPVYTQTGVLKKMIGMMTYSLTFEAKDNKYRYNITDFMYHNYAQNRNYKVVATGKKKHLEETKAPGWQKSWDECKETTLNKIKIQIASLKAKMIEQSIQIPTTDPKKSDW